MTAVTPLAMLKQAENSGLHLSVEGDGLVVESDNPSALTDEWRVRLRENKPALIRLLAGPPPLNLDEREDIREALNERAAIQEYDGGLTRADAENQAREALRVYRYRLTTNKDWCTLIAPGCSLADAEQDLRCRYEDRFVEVIEHRPVPRWEGMI